MIRGKIGERMVIARSGNYIKGVEVRLLERIRGHIKVEFLTEGWTKIGTIQWIRTGFGDEDWYKISRIGD